MTSEDADPGSPGRRPPDQSWSGRPFRGPRGYAQVAYVG